MPTIHGSLRKGFAGLGNTTDHVTLRTDRELPIKVVLLGSLAVSGVAGWLAWTVFASLGVAGGAALVAFVLSFIRLGRGGWSSGGRGGFGGGFGGSGGGGFSGGGGGFGGGGASGNW